MAVVLLLGVVAVVGWVVLRPLMNSVGGVAAGTSAGASPSASSPRPADTAEDPSPTPPTKPSAVLPLIFSRSGTIPVGPEVHNVVMSADGRLLFATTQGNDRVVVIDTTTEQVIQELDAAATPNSVAASPDGDAVYVARAGTDAVRAFDLVSGDVRDLTVGRDASSIEVSADGTQLYAALGDARSIVMVDLDTGRVLSRVRLDSEPGSLRRTPDGSRLVVSNSKSDTVTIVDVARSTIAAEVEVGDSPRRARVSRDGKMAVTANNGDGTVSLIDVDSGYEAARVRVGGAPRAAEFTADGAGVIVVGEDSTLSVIDVEQRTVVDTIGLGSPAFGVAIHPDGTTAFVANHDAGEITVLRRG